LKKVSFIALLFLFSSVVFALDFRYTKDISLKKDEQMKILVKYGQYNKLFKFRWTLYKNEGVVILRSYDKIVAQNILYERKNSRSFKVTLKPSVGHSYIAPYFLVKFLKYDFEKDEALFAIMLRDEEYEIQLEELQ